MRMVLVFIIYSCIVTEADMVNNVDRRVLTSRAKTAVYTNCVEL